MASATPKRLDIHIEGAQLHAQNVRLREDILLDEVHIESGDISVQPPESSGESARVRTGESRLRVVLSEPNLNTLAAANIPADAPVRNLRIVVLSGKLRATMQTVGFLSLPFAVEVVPKIDNGVRISLEWQGVQAAGFSLPGQLVEVLEQKLNKTIDLSTLPIPVWIDEIRCEPGRITAIGKARVILPPAPAAPPAPPFSARDLPVVPAAEQTPEAILVPPEETTPALAPPSESPATEETPDAT